MNTRVKRLMELSQLSEAAFLAAQARMKYLRAIEGDLRQKISALTADTQPQATIGGAHDNPALVEKVRFNWSVWAESRRRDLNTKLSCALADQARERVKLSVAFGKKEAVRHLFAKQKKLDLATAKNRALK